MPSTNPEVMKYLPPSNVIVGGPYGDQTAGPRVVNQKNYFFGKGGNDLLDTQSGNDWIFGGDGDDGLYGENGNDTMVGGPGDDEIIGGPGNDFIWGGDGNDYCDGDPCGKGDTCVGPGITYDDHIQLGPGNDVAIGRAGNDEIWGDDGDDIINGNEGDDIIRGGDGNDAIYGDVGNDDLRGGPGNDTVYGGAGTDLLYGEGGWDILHNRPPSAGAGVGINVLDAQPCGETDDVRYFNLATDKVIVVAGPGRLGKTLAAKGYKGLNITNYHHVLSIYVAGCAIPIATFGYNLNPASFTPAVVSVQRFAPANPPHYIGELPEPVPGKGGVAAEPPDGVISGSPLNDYLYGFNKGSNFTNYMFGLNLDDTLVGGPGPDYLLGGGHNDSLFGGDGDDVLESGPGYDVLWGEGGRDALFGGHDRQWLYGGGWGNWMTGGDFADFFYVDAPASCRATGPAPDIINNFGGPYKYYPTSFDTISIVTDANLALKSFGQLSITTTKGTANGTGASASIHLKGCAKPFLTAKFVGNNLGGKPVALTAKNVLFIKKSQVPKGPHEISEGYKCVICLKG